MFIQARNYTKSSRDDIRLVVIHSMESPEKPGTAVAVAKWFSGALAPKVSAHVCVDAVNSVECVLPQDIAWAAPGANRDGYHVELAGRAGQTKQEWLDDLSSRALVNAARVCAIVCQTWGIPPVRLTTEQVRDGKTRGFCGHSEVSLAFRKSDHWDPGPGFPWDDFLRMVRASLSDLEASQIGEK